MAEGYSIEIETSAAKQIARLQRGEQVRVAKAIKELAADPRPSGCTKLSGTTSSYRVRVGNYRIVYMVEDAIRVVTVTRVGHRREVYR
ncbi:MAG: type II toxin-antitoxin system RelE/ParE family toxin [Mycobacterium sp.]|nr:type II toxin-antitoxin system RelE/ParE family toxin [Mycobacterium sp.]